MTRVPRFVILPATENCRHPAKVPLHFSDIADWSDLKLLCLTPDTLSHPEIMAAGPKTAAGIRSAVEAISGGKVPAAEVPRILGTPTQPEIFSDLSVLFALEMLGHSRLPVLATKVVAPWVESELRAVEAPENWRFEYEKG